MVAWPNPWECPLITIEQAAPLLHMSRRTAYRAAAAGRIPTMGSKVPVAALMVLVGLPVPPPPALRPRIV